MLDKSNLPRNKKNSAAYQDADFALQHAVVRGETQEVIDALRKTRDLLKTQKE
jgi:hypothetical protein